MTAFGRGINAPQHPCWQSDIHSLSLVGNDRGVNIHQRPYPVSELRVSLMFGDGLGLGNIAALVNDSEPFSGTRSPLPVEGTASAASQVAQ